MKKKVLAAMLVAAMTATMFAGCGSKDNGASNDGTQAANNGSTSESAEPVDVKLTVMGPSEDQDDAQGSSCPQAPGKNRPFRCYRCAG